MVTFILNVYLLGRTTPGVMKTPGGKTVYGVVTCGVYLPTISTTNGIVRVRGVVKRKLSHDNRFDDPNFFTNTELDVVFMHFFTGTGVKCYSVTKFREVEQHPVINRRRVLSEV